jgi:hypothetical protein
LALLRFGFGYLAGVQGFGELKARGPTAPTAIKGLQYVQPAMLGRDLRCNLRCMG